MKIESHIMAKMNIFKYKGQNKKNRNFFFIYIQDRDFILI